MNGTELTFDPAYHEYRYAGRRVPSVTEILRETHISQDFDKLMMSNGPLRQQIELARAVGTAVHADAHAYDDGELDARGVDPRVEPFLDAWKTFRANTGLVPIVRERRVYHPGIGYAGTLDGIFSKHGRDRGPHVLIDIKTGDPDACAARYQLAAYLAAFQREHPEWPVQVIDRAAVQLCPELEIPYRIVPYSRDSQWRDIRKFQAFVTTYYNQYGRRAA